MINQDAQNATAVGAIPLVNATNATQPGSQDAFFIYEDVDRRIKDMASDLACGILSSTGNLEQAQNETAPAANETIAAIPIVNATLPLENNAL